MKLKEFPYLSLRTVLDDFRQENRTTISNIPSSSQAYVTSETEVTVSDKEYTHQNP